MERAEFDRVADEYAALHSRNIAVTGESPEFFARYKIEDAAAEAQRAGVEVRQILDFGSGIGNSLPHLAALFPNVMPSSPDPQNSLTIANASSTDTTLTVMTWVAVIFAPFVLLYEGWSYWVFRQRIGRALIPTAVAHGAAPAAVHRDSART